MHAHRRAVGWLGACLALAACSSGGDAGSSDGGVDVSHGRDSSMATEETGAPPVDDASSPGEDASLPTVDASPPSDDAPSEAKAAMDAAPLRDAAAGKDAGEAGVTGSYLSLMFYPGWVQTNTPPTAIDYTAVTHVMHFGFDPTTTGTICTCDMQSTSYPAVAIKAAHAAGKSIMVTVGEEGVGSDFVGATSAANLGTFIANIVALKNMYGYDGVDIDWEESVTMAPYLALMKGLRTALGPTTWLSVDVDTGQIPPDIVGAIEPYVTMVNDMSYWDSGATEQAAYQAMGVPAKKLTLGVGLSSGYFDSTQAAVQTKVTAIESNGWAGAMEWSLGDLDTATTDPRLIPLRALVAK